MVVLAFTALGDGLGCAIASRERTQVTNAAFQHEISSLTNQVQSLQLEIEKARREGRPPVKPNPIPVEKPVVITKEPEPLIQRAVSSQASKFRL